MINFNDLRGALDEFKESKNEALQGDWIIAVGGVECVWQLYYNGYVVLQCVRDGSKNALQGGFEIIEFADENKIIDIVKNEFQEVTEMTNTDDYVTRLASKSQEEYPDGSRIIVNESTKGTVVFVDDIGQVYCKLDNGKRMAMIPNNDNFRRLSPQELEIDEQQMSSQELNNEICR